MVGVTRGGVAGIGVVGCGNISGGYADTVAHHEGIELVAAYDVDPLRAQAYCESFGGKAFPSFDDLLACDDVDIVLNLTPHLAHREVTEAALRAGKHVYSEKPLAMTPDECVELARLADDSGVRLAASPITYMGEAQQTAWKALRDGRCGDIRVVYAEVNHGRIERWHPAPAPFYAVGPLFDVGVYPLTLLTAFFGPVRRVTATADVVHADRVAAEGPFEVTSPDWIVAVIELGNGVLVRLTTNFYVETTRQRGLEFHGDDASLYLGCFQEFSAEVGIGARGEPFQPLDLVRPPYPGIDWARGVADLAEAIRDGRPHRASPWHAAHVCEVMCAIATSAADGHTVDVASSFTPPTWEAWASPEGNR